MYTGRAAYHLCRSASAGSFHRSRRSVPDKEATGQKFVIIIDEWDVLIRDEASNQKIQDDYINFLRGMFKGTEPTKYIQLAFLTVFFRSKN